MPEPHGSNIGGSSSSDPKKSAPLMTSLGLYRQL